MSGRFARIASQLDLFDHFTLIIARGAMKFTMIQRGNENHPRQTGQSSPIKLFRTYDRSPKAANLMTNFQTPVNLTVLPMGIMQ